MRSSPAARPGRPPSTPPLPPPRPSSHPSLRCRRCSRTSVPAARRSSGARRPRTRRCRRLSRCALGTSLQLSHTTDISVTALNERHASRIIIIIIILSHCVPSPAGGGRLCLPGTRGVLVPPGRSAGRRRVQLLGEYNATGTVENLTSSRSESGAAYSRDSARGHLAFSAMGALGR